MLTHLTLLRTLCTYLRVHYTEVTEVVGPRCSLHKVPTLPYSRGRRMSTSTVSRRLGEAFPLQNVTAAAGTQAAEGNTTTHPGQSIYLPYGAAKRMSTVWGPVSPGLALRTWRTTNCT